MKKYLLALLFVLGITAAVDGQSQILMPIKWTFSTQKINDQEAVIIMKAKLDNNWHLYSQNLKPGGPSSTRFTFKPSADFQLVGRVAEPKSISAFDKTFEMQIRYFSKEATFKQRIKLKKPNAKISGTVEYQVCDDKQCLPPDELEFNLVAFNNKKS